MSDNTVDLAQIFPHYANRLRPQACLKTYTWFRCGGKADWLFLPENEQDLGDFLRHCPPEIPITVIGLASNIIIRDAGIEGVVIRLGKGFGYINHTNDGIIRVGTAVPDAMLAKYATEHAIAGMQFYRGIPGSIGGAIVMNAGAYGHETKDVLHSVRCLLRDGSEKTFLKNALHYRYRMCGIDTTDMIFISATFQGIPQSDKDVLKNTMQEYMDKRQQTQPIKERTGGSTFKNPDGQKAWQLIEASGCRGLRVGGAQMSELHCNFMINRQEASAADLENLGEEVRKRVYHHTGVHLEWEIKRIGRMSHAR